MAKYKRTDSRTSWQRTDRTSWQNIKEQTAGLGKFRL
jgi:hypothetical protein